MTWPEAFASAVSSVAAAAMLITFLVVMFRD
jgi:hypothetical protein